MSKRKKKGRKSRQAAKPARMVSLAADILAGAISGLITAAILKLLKW